MKKPWLMLAAVLAFVAIATSTRQNRTQKYSPRRLFEGCSGCYTVLAMGRVPDVPDENSTWKLMEPLKLPPRVEIEHVRDENSTWKLMEPLKLPLPEVQISRVEDSISPILEPSELAPRPSIRAKRARKTAAFAPRRGKQRARTRPVCRGCYSGLMIIAPPVQERENGSLKESDSESGEDSSVED